MNDCIPSYRLFNLIAVPAALTFTGYACTGDQRPSVSRPNVIVIVTDDQGWGDLSINGNKNLNTPNIDKLAVNGAYFTQFYVCPVCSPTRAEFLTGRYHPRCGVYDTSEGGERMNLGETTIAEVFKKAGYATGAFGKWHNGMQYPYHPNGRGFDEFYGFCSGHWGDYFSPPLEHNGKIVKGDGYITDDLTEKAMLFMEDHAKTPFFLYIPYNSPHAPMQVPELWWNKFKDKNIEMLSDKKYDEDITFTRAALAMCENIDWNVGHLMDKLKALNLEKNTIVIYFHDNGPNGWRWNGGMKGRKGSTDEGGVRSPLFMYWQSVIDPGLKIEKISASIDLLPTLAEIAGIKYETQNPLDGKSLYPLLFNDNNDWNDRLIFSHWAGRVIVRSQQYRLDQQGKLFDMITDPGQLTDISQIEPEITGKLSESVKNWKADVLPGISSDERKFPIGHPDFKYTQLPARDGKAHGGITRSNIWPNSSFFTNWTKTDDKITWDVEVLTEGIYEVEIFYTCPEKDVGAVFELSFDGCSLKAKITEAHDPPLRGMENDRVPRTNSYVKDFKSLKAGKIRLVKGSGQLKLQALEIPGSQVMDFRLMMLTKMNN
jgi:arylsulfatase A-like enzyme